MRYVEQPPEPVADGGSDYCTRLVVRRGAGGGILIEHEQRYADETEWRPDHDAGVCMDTPDVAIAVARAILELAGERSGECHRRDCPVCDGIEG